MGSQGSGPRKKSFALLQTTAIPPTLIQSPPPSETTEVLSPSPTRKSKSRILLTDAEEIDQSELLCGGPEPILAPDGELTPTSNLPRDSQIDSAPDRVRSPFYPQHPHVVDPASLRAAVLDDPQHIFDSIKILVQARDCAQWELGKMQDRYDILEEQYKCAQKDHKDVMENYKGAQLDHKSAQDTWDRLLKIEKGKQVLLWKFIDQLQRGGNKSSGPLDRQQEPEGELAGPSSHEDERRNATLKRALDEAISAAEGEPLLTSSISNLQTTSTDGGNTDGIEELLDWKMRGTLDPSAVCPFFCGYYGKPFIPMILRVKLTQL